MYSAVELTLFQCPQCLRKVEQHTFIVYLISIQTVDLKFKWNIRGNTGIRGQSRWNEGQDCSGNRKVSYWLIVNPSLLKLLNAWDSKWVYPSKSHSAAGFQTKQGAQRDPIFSGCETQNRVGLLPQIRIVPKPCLSFLWSLLVPTASYFSSRFLVAQSCTALAKLEREHIIWRQSAFGSTPFPRKGVHRVYDQVQQWPSPPSPDLVFSFNDGQEENGSPSPEPGGKSYWFRVLRRCWWPQVQRLVATRHWEGEKKK